MSMDDDATDREIFERKLITDAHNNRLKENPDFNEKGNRICLDCDIEIIIERVEAVDAVRCVTCQGIEDKSNRGYV